MLASNQSLVGVQTRHLQTQVRAETAGRSKRGTNRQESTLADQRCCPLACLSQTLHSSASYPARKVMVASCPHSSLPSPPARNSQRHQKQVIKAVACRPVVCKQCYDTVSTHKYAKAVPCSSVHQAAQANQNHAYLGMASTAGPRHVHS